ncbi:alpha/beta hydrolase [Sneathiella marina]|uniref:Alpha/beta hydrolase n=1 Tax=Sneathiella marina TaxID=2950108 RepID=A0ABY4VY25_9PROT|nr:alpha/beta hydrolase [Sneathiella marina]USG59825.1 alpha/beta hydrolase [Sneathiella marina]
MPFAEHFYQSTDGLNLYYREYGTIEDHPPLLCLSGLTRNSADFHDFAERYCGNRKVYTLDYRGRGKSDYDANFENYNPQVYAGDIYNFLTSKNIQKAVFVGTSLGGLLTMGMAGFAKHLIAGAILNDVGPEIDTSGGNRILEYVGKDIRYDSIEVASKAQRVQYLNAYPDLSDAEWISQSKKTFVFDKAAGNFRFNYDMNLGPALAKQFDNADPVDLWPFFAELKGIPTLAIRGARSDVLSQEVFRKMQIENPEMQAITLENRGHVPLLDEPPLLKEMDQFIAGIR